MFQLNWKYSALVEYFLYIEYHFVCQQLHTQESNVGRIIINQIFETVQLSEISIHSDWSHFINVILLIVSLSNGI